LKSIPDDLRDPTSRYLGRKIDACDREIFPAPNTRWVGLKEHPSDPSLVLALQSDGALCTLNPISGEVVVLWKVERKGRGLFMLAVSEDGKVAAIAFSRGTNAGEIEVFDFSSGQKMGSTLSYNYGLRELRVTGQRVLASFPRWIPPTCHAFVWTIKRGRNFGSGPILPMDASRRPEVMFMASIQTGFI
jgi:hypothetical protein